MESGGQERAHILDGSRGVQDACETGRDLQAKPRGLGLRRVCWGPRESQGVNGGGPRCRPRPSTFQAGRDLQTGGLVAGQFLGNGRTDVACLEASGIA